MNVLLVHQELSSDSNGLLKNIFVLKSLLRNLNCKVYTSHLPGVKYDKIIQVDKIINHSLLLEIKSKNPSAKNIHLIYGNKMIGDIENLSSNRIALNSQDVDEVWISPHYNFCIEYIKVLYRVNTVRIAPYIWSPDYIKFTSKYFNKKIISIIEPNLSVTKSCLPSIMIVEYLYRKNPKSFDMLNIFCCEKNKESKYFLSILNTLTIFKDKKVNLYPRVNMETIFCNANQVVVSHQLMNELNYAYMECFHFNIPLVHNSKAIKDCGYYYSDYNVIQGSEQLSQALSNIGKKNTNKNTSKILNKYSPRNKNVIQKYKSILEID